MLSKEALSAYSTLHEQLPLEEIETGLKINKISFQEFAKCLADAKEYPYIDIHMQSVDPNAASLLDEKWANEYCVLPFKIEKNTVHFACGDPYKRNLLDNVALALEKNVVPYVACWDDLQKCITTTYTGIRVLAYAMSKNADAADDDTRVKHLLDAVLQQAYQQDASDIHIEPDQEGGHIRYRVDGLLYPVVTIDKNTLASLGRLLKVLSGLNIADKRIPQEGHMAVTPMTDTLDCRVSTMPVIDGEKLVVRFIYRAKKLLHKSQLGFFPEDMKQIDMLLKNNQGLILITGPTGSGKTTTLASMLQDMDAVRLNIVAIEDPVEHHLPGMNQIQVNEKTGLSFPLALRSILRQDPDVIMVGEVRDKETVETTFKAAVTGHLVLSSLHTNNAIGAIVRLLDMGVEGYLIASALKGVISQRLVRRLCPRCKKEEKIAPQDAAHFGVDSNTMVFIPVGCPYCRNKGYSGRFAVYEILTLTQEMTRYIVPEFMQKEFYHIARKAICPIKENLLRNILLGNTSLEEYYRVVYYDEI